MNAILPSGAFWLGLVALGTRLFWAACVDEPGLLNAGWMPALAAGLLTVPLAVCLTSLEREKKPPRAALEAAAGQVAARLYALILCLCMLYEAALSVRLLAFSAQYVALDGVPTGWLMCACALAAFACAVLGVQAVGGACKVLLWVIAFLLAVAVAVQVPAMRPRWLTPVWGPGVRALAEPLPALCGMMTGAAALWLNTSARDESAPAWRSLPGMVIFSGAAAAILLALYAMLAPAMPSAPDTRAFQLDRLLANGRIAVSLQFVMVLLWYACLMIELVFSLALAASTAAVALPRLPFKPVAAACAALSLALALSPLSRQSGIGAVNAVRLAAVTAPAFAFAAAGALRAKKGGAGHAGN